MYETAIFCVYICILLRIQSRLLVKCYNFIFQDEYIYELMLAPNNAIAALAIP